jgi:hypothetical protein
MARAHGQLRRSQVITTWGPGSLIDLPQHSGIVAGLDSWPRADRLAQVIEPRLTRKITLLTGVPNPPLYAPPPDSAAPGEPQLSIGVYRFPEWMIVQEDGRGEDTGERSRRLVHRNALDEKGRFEGKHVVPTRFVRACPRGHIEDLDWRGYVHQHGDSCNRQLWLSERGTGGDLADLSVRCECGAIRGLHEAADLSLKALGNCRGRRPWLGAVPHEPCGQPSRLLIRTATNAYFAQVLSALSLPEQGSAAEQAVRSQWEILQAVNGADELAVMRKISAVAAALAGLSDDEVLAAIDKLRGGELAELPVKLVELDALLAQPEGYEDDVPINPDFHARRLPPEIWRSSPLTDSIAAVIQLHRLREVLALIGFTRFEAEVPDINGEFDTDVTRAELAIEPKWFPAVENHGEGLFVQLDTDAVLDWLGRPRVKARLDHLAAGHARWTAQRKSERPFPGGPYVLLHTLSHLLIGAVAMRCGYPASSIRERIYADYAARRFGLLLYTASAGAEGTLGGLVGQARHIATHLRVALRAGTLCSNDPVCAQHSPAEGMEDRWLHGASCHGCTLIAETSCEMRNDYLDRALVVPTLAVPDAAFFPAAP